MQYIQYIESTQEWTCPKTGKWKVICVGGGGSGYTKYSSYTYAGNPGGTTSFGTYLSANGGAGGSSYFTNNSSSSGINGFDGCVEYKSSNNTTVGVGYGASGGTSSTISGSQINTNAGMPGEVRTTVVDIEENSVVSCTVGEGGTAVKTNYQDMYVYAGRAGVIILEYLG